ncbi:TetR/AcrR family transcriptional regulator C-terminal domain-containing protein [Actinomadura sp. DC4]|uniref:TetR/AcrR family transcriptional regulator C-terminal domain-containing protein n=1 Tax=Actinomadura sp. DC4 TaxID=3055069 RepID=UPI0025AF027E|nr:TetR/AcrR family transcriptional regulator C-terminal domain-containing protein [Actinomadura sp. DC4]MDN3354401.1 TetR/AcrR family transcriptional regulator C-terminal domain-containing protein [Actinomadura sp. DC4]
MGQRRAEVLQAAIELLDEVGLDGLTMRVLAARLGVRASALYRHYPSKQALLDAMVAHLATRPADAAPPLDGTWDERLREIATGMREVMLAHRDGARLIATFHDPGGEAVAAFRDLVAALAAEGVPAETAVSAVDTVLAYTNGFTIEEQARKAGTGAWPRDRRDHAFRTGLDLILAGVRESALK